ncbi:ParB/RepB/Spo0J family partition protein [Nesterenkonia sp.]|uniref:ParB/RepB/Spo0J family partition protein n=1 Tax=Nesterenkonia sp. TaxID=704201 RepID=UPI002624B83A|nr:ParB/RepB/Spo0J family partition protein [Nesterenkonia sp.]
MTTSTELRELPIEAVKPNPRNIRDDIDETAESLERLAHTIKVDGIINPLVVFPSTEHEEEESWLVADGHRRLAAARQAGLATVPALVKESEDAAAEAVKIMLTTGTTSERLNLREEARGIQQLLDLGVSKTRISKELKQKAQHVEAKAKVARAPEELATSYYSGAVDVEGMIALQKLETEDPDLHAKVTKRIAGIRSRVDVEREIEQVRRHESAEQLRAELEAAGASEAPFSAQYGDGWEESDLDAAGEPLPISEHVSRGHRYLIEPWREVGDQLRWFARVKAAKQELSEEEKAARRRLRALNKELALTAVSRDKHQRRKLQEKKPADQATLQRMMARRLWREAGFWSVGGAWDPDNVKAVLLEELTGLPRPRREDGSRNDHVLFDEWVQWREKAKEKFERLTLGQLIFVWEYLGSRQQDRELQKAAGYRQVLDPNGESGDHFAWRMEYLDSLPAWGWEFDQHEQQALQYWDEQDSEAEEEAA